MPAFTEKYGPWALVTGAAMGLGAEFARQLAAQGLNLILVDVQVDRLNATARDVSVEFSVGARPVVLDLAAPELLSPLIAATQDLEVGLLVNNAGISSIGHFLDVPLEKHLRILAVDVRAPLVLAHHFGGLMCARKRGGIIFVSSMSALAGTSHVSAYSATNAHDWTLAEALWYELRPYGVDVLTTIVGAADTPGWRAENPNPEAKTWPPVMSAVATVKETLGALGQSPKIAPGHYNRLATFLITHLLPRRMAIEMLGKEMDKRYRR